MLSYLLLVLLLLILAGFALGHRKALAIGATSDVRMHSLASYHGWYVAALVGIPSFVLVLLWLLFQGPIIDWLLIGSLPKERVEGLDNGQLDLLVTQIKSVAAGNIFSEPDEFVLAAAERYNRWNTIADWALFALAVTIALAGIALAQQRISARFRARNTVELVMSGLMIACSLIAILTTFGIVASLLYESLRFFDKVSVIEFLTGLNTACASSRSNGSRNPRKTPSHRLFSWPAIKI